MAPGLCENCHKKRKFGAHKFCGRTCAAQAAAKPTGKTGSKAKPATIGRQKAVPVPQKAVQLCDYCGQKPRFSNFDFCGKSCATLANSAQTKQPTAQVPSASNKKTGRVPSAPQNNPAPVRLVKTVTPPQAKAPQAVPQDDSTEEEGAEDEDDADVGVDTDLDAYPSDSEEEPAAPAAVVPPATKNTSKGGKPGGPPKPPPGTCAIPNCGKPSHVDKNGVKTGYCSIKHREEAVTLGLEAPCIMCQRYPQGASDYFCSSACRKQSMVKT
ncbi:hypothetical protein HYDPIDRAFT_111234 [Hydnomerulius pinastri MD-312]|uniref:Uncharacterized protein n=1 Tax=Hydnomerulius pinastri MD-312 TaxID=994086 RepID=A0A0C9WGE8_9AGAM|nr:hypothetical protein HYDPIDRAFT_111234 [Hydnomerulius pinastri MD-312]